MGTTTPSEITRIANKMAAEKAKFTIAKLLTLSFLAGAYISFGGLLSILIGGGVPQISIANPGIARFLFGAAFPLGLILVVLAGAELFTGNNAYFIPNVLSKNQSWKAPLRNWTFVYIGNFFGALFVAYFLTHLTDLVSQSPWKETIQNIATNKMGNPFYKTVLKGIGANWLVCLALWLGMSAKNTSGKILGLWWPVMAFVVMGFEHSIANMYFVPLAIFEGAQIGWGSFIVENLIPATIGNIIGGAFFVGTLYWFAYDK